LYKKIIFRCLALVSQLGFSVLTPVLLCTFLGTWLDKRYNTAFTLPLLIFGILAGANAAYKILSTYIEASKKENDRQVSRLLKKDNIDKEEKVHIPKMKSRIYKDY
jgi:hypothetical protein